VLKDLGFQKMAQRGAKYIRTRGEDIDLTDVVSSRLALEGSRIPKNVKGAKTYADLKKIPYLGERVKERAISKAIRKHRPLFSKVLKTVDNPKDSVNTIADKTLDKLLLPTDKLLEIHRSDSLNYVGAGNLYPAALDVHFTKFKKTPRYKELTKGK